MGSVQLSQKIMLPSMSYAVSKVEEQKSPELYNISHPDGNSLTIDPNSKEGI